MGRPAGRHPLATGGAACEAPWPRHPARGWQLTPSPPTPLPGRLYYQDSPFTYISSTYGGDQYAPWWGITDEAGVNQPFGNGFPQTCLQKDPKGRYCVLGAPLQATSYSFATDTTTTTTYNGTLTQYLSGYTIPGSTLAPVTSQIPGGYAVMMPTPGPATPVNNAFSQMGLALPPTSGSLQYFSAYNKGRVSPGRLPINLDAAVSSVALCGTLAGQLFFGWAGDKFGRKSVYGLTLFVMIFCAAAQSMSFGVNGVAVIGTLCWWRFFLGFGVGGDYPLSATIMSEYSSRLSRGAFVSAVFAMQGVGILTAAAVSIIVVSIFNGYYPSLPYPADDMAGNPTLYWSLIQQSCPRQSDFVWRVVLGFGAFPAATTMYLRSTMPETPRYTLHVQKNKEQLAADMTEVTNMELDSAQTQVTKHEHMTFGMFLKKHGKELLGCAMTWFLLDVAFYSQNLFQKDVFLQIGWLPPAASVNAMTETFRVARAQALIALGSTIPGYYFTVFTVDFMGRLKIQYMGFAMMTAFMAAIAGGFNHLLLPNTNDGMGLNNMQPNGRNGFVTLYALCFFFANWGPNATTFVVPAELFPTKWKSTGHGISAASGKAGAIIGAFGFLFASQPAKGELTWKFPCVNTPMFGFTSYQWNFNGNSPKPLASPIGNGDGPYQALTAYFQNVASAGFVAAPIPNTPFFAKPPFKNSAAGGAQYLYTGTGSGQYTQTPAAFTAGNYATALGNGFTATQSAAGLTVTGNTGSTYTNGGVSTFVYVGGATQFFANSSLKGPAWVDSSDGIYNPWSYNFPQVYPATMNVKNFKTATQLPANSTACLVKPNCPGGQIATPALNNGYKSYKCVCPIPAPLGGCFPNGIGVQGALGILAGTNFLGMLFTVLEPETNGKTLEQLSGEYEADVDNEKEVATSV